MSILAFLATVAYANRASLAQFGLDDTNAMLALYLMIGPCGAAYSVDNWLKRRRAGGKLPVEPRIGANFAIRLLQVQLCVVYFFSGIGKAQGPAVVERRCHFDGHRESGIPVAERHVADSLSRPGLAAHAHHRVLGISYCALVWPRLTRPIVIAIAFGIHLGIGLFLGMWTFGLAMCIANMAFVSPWVVRRIIDRIAVDCGDSRAAAMQASRNLLMAIVSRASAQQRKPSNAHGACKARCYGPRFHAAPGVQGRGVIMDVSHQRFPAFMNLHPLRITRRQFLATTGSAIGAAGLWAFTPGESSPTGSRSSSGNCRSRNLPETLVGKNARPNQRPARRALCRFRLSDRRHAAHLGD